MAWLRRLAIAGAALGVALLAGALPVSADAPTIRVALASAQVGGRAAVAVDAVAIPAPGMGAWTVNIAYDPRVVQVVSCTATEEGLSVCNPQYNDHTVRLTGAKANGLAGDNTLASMTFECKGVGATVLTVSISVLVDATVGTPTPINAAAANGAIACAAPEEGRTPEAIVTPAPGSGTFPIAGGGPGGWNNFGPFAWPIAGLAGAGIAWLAAGLLTLGGRAASAGPAAPARREERRERRARASRPALRPERLERPIAAPSPRPAARPTSAVTLRVKQVEDFPMFVDVLGALGRIPRVVEAHALRFQDGEGVFEVTVAAPLTPTSLVSEAERTLGRPVRFSSV